MSFIDNNSSTKFWNVVRGHIENRASGESHGGFVGVITGMRVVDGAYNSEPTRQLHVCMRDEADTEIIIAMRLCTFHRNRPDCAVPVARMLMERLIRPKGEPEIPTNESLTVGFYSFGDGDKPATCCSVRRADGTKISKGVELGKEWKDQHDKAIIYLIGRYGEIKQRTAQPEYDDHGPDKYDSENDPHDPVTIDESTNDLPF